MAVKFGHAAALLALCAMPIACALDNGVGLVPAAGWSSWNVFAGRVTAEDVMGMADVMVAKGLDKLGYIYVAIDCGWNLHTRDAEGNLQPDPNKFPDGIGAVAKYVNGLGGGLLKLGLYTDHYTDDCCGGPGMKGHEDQDAAFYKANGIEYLKVDSCAGHTLTPRAMYDDFANIRDALNRSGSPVYLNICPTLSVDDPSITGLHPPCHGYSNYVYTSRGFAALGHDVRHLANSALVEYCNNANNWGIVLTLVDAQAALADDDWSAPGSWVDADMLTVGCNDNPIPGTPCAYGEPMTVVEEYSQFSLWCIFASNLMLGSDLRNVSASTLAIISNHEALGVNRDALGARGRLVWQSGNATQNLTCAAGGTAAYDMHRANMTLSEAKEWCIGTSRCAGFAAELPFATSECTERAGQVLDLHFLDGWAMSRTGSNVSWTHWTAAPPTPPTLQIFAKPLTPTTQPGMKGSEEQEEGAIGRTRRAAVAVLNRGPTAANVTVEWSMLSFGGATWARRSSVRDLWAHEERGVFEGSFAVEKLASHATALLVVTEVM